MELRKCTSADYASLVEIWEESVRESHGFLSENDIQEIKGKLAGCYFPAVKLYSATAEDGATAGFIGLSEHTIEMLFIKPEHQRKGYGKAMIDFARSEGITLVDVNEQNPRALKFYIKQGFHVTRRDPVDEAGRPFPILHLSL